MQALDVEERAVKIIAQHPDPESDPFCARVIEVDGTGGSILNEPEKTCGYVVDVNVSDHHASPLKPQISRLEFRILQ
jgi:hypothetical protein